MPDKTKETIEMQPSDPSTEVPTEQPAPAESGLANGEPESARLSKIKVDETDLLRVENVFLKAQNLESQIRMLDAQKLQLIEQLKKLQQEMLDKKKALGEKYGIDMDKVDVDADGNVKPRVQLPNMPSGMRRGPVPMPGPRR